MCKFIQGIFPNGLNLFICEGIVYRSGQHIIREIVANDTVLKAETAQKLLNAPVYMMTVNANKECSMEQDGKYCTMERIRDDILRIVE